MMRRQSAERISPKGRLRFASLAQSVKLITLNFTLWFCALTFLLFVLNMAICYADSESALRLQFQQANALYKEAKYSEAIQGYEHILAQGIESGNLYFNIGNSYFKVGTLGKAILNYERARFLIPNDSDLKSNYDYTVSLLNRTQEQFPGNRFQKALDTMTDGLGVDSLTAILSLVYLGILSLLLLSFFFGFMRKKVMPAVGVCIALFSLVLICLNRKIAFFERGAVVINAEAQVRFEPQEQATVYFKVYEGSKVEVVEKSGSWYKIRRNGNLRGWLPQEAVEGIAPSERS